MNSELRLNSLIGVEPMRFLRLPLVEERSGFSRATIYRKMATEPPEFPRAYKIGAKSVAWLESEINQWISDRLIRQPITEQR